MITYPYTKRAKCKGYLYDCRIIYLVAITWKIHTFINIIPLTIKPTPYRIAVQSSHWHCTGCYYLARRNILKIDWNDNTNETRSQYQSGLFVWRSLVVLLLHEETINSIFFCCSFLNSGSNMDNKHEQDVRHNKQCEHLRHDLILNPWRLAS